MKLGTGTEVYFHVQLFLGLPQWMDKSFRWKGGQVDKGKRVHEAIPIAQNLLDGDGRKQQQQQHMWHGIAKSYSENDERPRERQVCTIGKGWKGCLTD